MKFIISVMFLFIAFISGSVMADSPPLPTVATTQGGTTTVFYPGWNLLGNALDTDINVGAVFGSAGNSTSITSSVKAVWKWSNDSQSWEFYSPQASEAQLLEFLKNHNYNRLQVIRPGEGYWVHASAAGEVLQFGNNGNNVINDWMNKTATDGWKLFAVPVQPQNMYGYSPLWSVNGILTTLSDQFPDPQSIAGLGVVETMWRWNRELGAWSFYSPMMRAVYGDEYMRNFAYLNNVNVLYYGEGIPAGDAFWVHVIHREKPAVVPQLPQVYQDGQKG